MKRVYKYNVNKVIKKEKNVYIINNKRYIIIIRSDYMKKILSIISIFVFSVCFIGTVKADEAALSDVATISSTIGGQDKEITQTDTNNKYKFYYKYVAISEKDFNDYIAVRTTLENSEDNSDAYTSSATKVAEYESNFQKLIPTPSVKDVQGYTLSTDGNINLSNLSYEKGKHNGYVLAVAAVKDGDTSRVYISRLILESTSATTLGEIEIADEASTVTTNDTNADNNSQQEEVKTTKNPETGISDYAIYLVPVCLILGSTLLLKRRYS